ncbi:hypothetical protein M378DRAFT_504280 [Amanita muscaria Koide BX008]|uniref:Choline kinase n=1 Tax=Amanita muscaria (strain Koide BX008) TaxID=946122 RepID=A0A0C2TUP9_AMAMK|nr:hypothetical protein M378DRAFT_504280 [Amanita muscaria Koide BX008]
MSLLQTPSTSPSRPMSLTDIHASSIISAFEILKAKFRAVSASSPYSIRRAQKKAVSSADNELRHATMRFDPRHYKNAHFVTQLLTCCRTLAVPHWSGDISPDKVVVRKVSGSLTNAVFFVSCPTLHYVPTILLRIYGPSSGSLISRPKELNTLHILSSQYSIGPRIYGTFDNGRIEEYFESTTLTPADIRDPAISRWIGARMAELHSVDISVVDISSKEQRDDTVKRNVAAWLEPAQAVLALPSLPEYARQDLDLERFRTDWDKYIRWLSKVDDVKSGGRRVFAHNDTQYGNLLRLKQVQQGLQEHYQIVVVDFEYAGPNPAAYDIANHFHEWTANYHSSAPHILNFSNYPNAEERRNFYAAYLGQSRTNAPGVQTLYDKLDKQVTYWSPASHAMWALWGIVQAREDVEGNVQQQQEFDYIAYAQCRMAAFRRELHSLGVLY